MWLGIQRSAALASTRWENKKKEKKKKTRPVSWPHQPLQADCSIRSWQFSRTANQSHF